MTPLSRCAAGEWRDVSLSRSPRPTEFLPSVCLHPTKVLGEFQEDHIQLQSNHGITLTITSEKEGESKGSRGQTRTIGRWLSAGAGETRSDTSSKVLFSERQKALFFDFSFFIGCFILVPTYLTPLSLYVKKFLMLVYL
jgi:hypothetical protein